MLSAIVLSAGESKRMGDINKLLLKYQNKVVIEHIVSKTLQSNVDEVIIVLGYQAEKIKSIVDKLPVQIIINSSFIEGMTSSIQAGVKGSSPKADGYMILLSDLLGLQVNQINAVINAFNTESRNTKKIVIPRYKGVQGHPVIFSKHFRNEILNHQKPNGLKNIIQNNPESVIFVEMENEFIYLDVDDVHQYNKFITTLKSDLENL